MTHYACTQHYFTRKHSVLLQVLGFNVDDEGVLEVLPLQQGNQRRNHYVAEEGHPGMVSLLLYIYHSKYQHPNIHNDSVFARKHHRPKISKDKVTGNISLHEMQITSTNAHVQTNVALSKISSDFHVREVLSIRERHVPEYISFGRWRYFMCV